MVVLSPFTGVRVRDADARAVVAPAYDRLAPAEREALAADDPLTFLNVLPPGGPVDDDLATVLAANRTALHRVLTAGRFTPLPAACLAVLTLTAGDERIVYVVGTVAVDAYGDGRVLPHERVRPERVDQLARYLDVVGAVSSPVCVAHRPDPAVAAALGPVLVSSPEVAFRDVDGIEVALFVVAEPDRIAALAGAIEATGPLYLADGHHRAAAVAEHARRHELPADHPGAQVLTAAVASDQLTVLPFHRRVRLGPGDHGLGDVEVAHWLAARDLPVVPLAGATVPDRPGTFTVVQHGRWWLVDARERARPGPVEGLDVRLLEREVLGPLLASDDPAHDSRVEAVAHPVGLQALDQPGAVGFALHPPGIEALVRVSQAAAVMPPKTTYVTPKLRSGLLVVPHPPAGLPNPPACPPGES